MGMFIGHLVFLCVGVIVTKSDSLCNNWCEYPLGSGRRRCCKDVPDVPPTHATTDDPFCKEWCEYPLGSGRRRCCRYVPVNGGWSVWSSWSKCSYDCQQSRSRSCKNPEPQNGGLDCHGDPISTQNCTSGNCPVNGGWSSWSSWSTCSRNCQQSRIRTCNYPKPQNGGLNCLGDPASTQNCTGGNCDFCIDWCEHPIGSRQYKCCEALTTNTPNF